MRRVVFDRERSARTLKDLPPRRWTIVVIECNCNKQSEQQGIVQHEVQTARNNFMDERCWVPIAEPRLQVFEDGGSVRCVEAERHDPAIG